MRSLQALITFQIALQVCMGLQIISGSDMWDDLEKGNQKMWDGIANRNQKMGDGFAKGLRKKWDDIEKGNDRHHKDWDDLSQNEKGQSGGPPPVLNLTSEVGASCSCGKVLLSSLGPAANFQPQAMGTYTM